MATDKALTNRARTTLNKKAATTIKTNGSGASGGGTKAVFADKARTVVTKSGGGHPRAAKTVVRAPRGKR